MDESRFSRYASERRQVVFSRPGERFEQCCISPRRQFGGGELMIWGGISLKARTALVTVKVGSMTTDRYIRECLEEHVVPFAPFIGPNFVLMQDNARPHVVQVTMEYLEYVGIQVSEWPARSPDLNPTKHMWSNLERRIRRNYGEFQTAHQLEQALLTEWELIPQNEVTALIESIPQRLRAVI